MSAELRPPRAELALRQGWTRDRHLSRGQRAGARRTYVFLTDSAVGARRKQSATLVINLGSDVPRDRVVPFRPPSTRWISISAYRQSLAAGFSSLVVLGGDRSSRTATLCLTTPGSSARRFASTCRTSRSAAGPNPHADAVKQAAFVDDDRFSAEFFLTQVVSHRRHPWSMAFWRKWRAAR